MRKYTVEEFQTKLNKIYCCDCVIGMKAIPDNSIDLVVMDPPYFLPAKHYATRKTFKRNFADLGILESFFKGVFEELSRVLKPTARFYIFCDGQSYPLFYYYSYFFTKSVRPLIWDKKTSINGYSWRHQHEIIIFGEMPKARPVPTGDGDILRYSAVKVNQRKHPAEKPVDLFEALIDKSSKKEDVILDPFIGSGTTAIACKKLNRNFIGFELSQEYIDVANKRLADIRD